MKEIVESWKVNGGFSLWKGCAIAIVPLLGKRTLSADRYIHLVCLKSWRSDTRAARREVFVDSCCTTTTQLHTLVQQQQISLPSAECSWSFIHPVPQTSPPAAGSYSHM